MAYGIYTCKVPRSQLQQIFPVSRLRRTHPSRANSLPVSYGNSDEDESIYLLFAVDFDYKEQSVVVSDAVPDKATLITR